MCLQGLKHEARAAAQPAKVPVLPGSELVSNVKAALEQAEMVGYPVMLKATGGGGGMGMVVYHSAEDLTKKFATTVALTIVSSQTRPTCHPAIESDPADFDDLIPELVLQRWSLCQEVHRPGTAH